MFNLMNITVFVFIADMIRVITIVVSGYCKIRCPVFGTYSTQISFSIFRFTSIYGLFGFGLINGKSVSNLNSIKLFQNETPFDEFPSQSHRTVQTVSPTKACHQRTVQAESQQHDGRTY